MTAILEARKTLDPLSKSWGWSVVHPTTGDGSWKPSLDEAVHTLMLRLRPRGWNRVYIEHKNISTQGETP